MHYVVHGSDGLDRYSVAKTWWYANGNDSKDAKLEKEMARWWNMDSVDDAPSAHGTLPHWILDAWILSACWLRGYYRWAWHVARLGSSRGAFKLTRNFGMQWKQKGFSFLRALPIYDQYHRWKIRIGNGFGAIWESRISLHWSSQDLNWWYCVHHTETWERGLSAFARAHSLPVSDFVLSAIDEICRFDLCVATLWNGEEIWLQWWIFEFGVIETLPDESRRSRKLVSVWFAMSNYFDSRHFLFICTIQHAGRKSHFASLDVINVRVNHNNECCQSKHNLSEADLELKRSSWQVKSSRRRTWDSLAGDKHVTREELENHTENIAG